jgi:hypothetical protein
MAYLIRSLRDKLSTSGTRRRTCKKRDKADKDQQDESKDRSVEPDEAVGEGNEPPRKKKRRTSGSSGSADGDSKNAIKGQRPSPCPTARVNSLFNLAVELAGVKENVTGRPRSSTTSAIAGTRAARRQPTRPTIYTTLDRAAGTVGPPPSLALDRSPHSASIMQHGAGVPGHAGGPMSAPALMNRGLAASGLRRASAPFFGGAGVPAPNPHATVNISKSFARPVDVNIFQPAPEMVSDVKPWQAPDIYRPSDSASPHSQYVPLDQQHYALPPGQGRSDWWDELVAQYSTNPEQS